ncbi:MAG: hypothetical protein LLG42_07230 [Chloroflexi bacterium]|nr:hypothetical protein [Chloroflexota bacterium]
MSQVMGLLRGPALVVIAMIILLAGFILFSAFAALIAQMALLFKLKPWKASQKHPEWTGSEIGKEQSSQEQYERYSSANETKRSSPSNCQGSPSEHPRRGQVVVNEPSVNEVVDAVWWQV